MARRLPRLLDRVFRALTEQAELTCWFAQNVDIGTAIGAPFRFWGRHTLAAGDPEDARQVITRYAAGESLGFSWPLYAIDTDVAIELATEGEQSTLQLEHIIRGDLPVDRQNELIDDHWRLAMGNLAAHLAGGAGIVLTDYHDPKPEVRLSIRIEATPSSVFRALIEPDAINRWFGTNASEVDPRVGGTYKTNWSYKIDGRDVLAAPYAFSSLNPIASSSSNWPDWRGDEAVPMQSIAFLLAPEGGTTRLTFVHAGFVRTTDVSDFPFGWGYFLNQLKAVAEGVAAGAPTA